MVKLSGEREREKGIGGDRWGSESVWRLVALKQTLPATGRLDYIVETT